MKPTEEENSLCIDWFKERDIIAKLDDAGIVYIEIEIDGSYDTLVLHDCEVKHRARLQEEDEYYPEENE